jgi:mannose-6-phosphate isomerase-like protein (cupin superfamily)
MFITQYGRGEGPDQHLHPYPEVFVVQTGRARFTVDGEDIVVDAGNVVVVRSRRRMASRTQAPRRCALSACTRARRVQQTDL